MGPHGPIYGPIWAQTRTLETAKGFVSNKRLCKLHTGNCCNKNDAESSRNFIKKQVLDPKRAKFVQKSLRKVYGKYTESSKTSKTCPGRPIWAHMGPYMGPRILSVLLPGKNPTRSKTHEEYGSDT